MKKALPFIYISFGFFILVGTIFQFFQHQEVYRVLFNFETTNKYIFLLVRIIFASWFLFDGVKRLKQHKED
ncbi:hypothetical protein [Tenacibaculum insulae]|uniref:hypothetical protein n=1 Tax=Tenacibaculum insulae TaxID=2029677 RepID=UPI003AB4DCA6